MYNTRHIQAIAGPEKLSLISTYSSYCAGNDANLRPAVGSYGLLKASTPHTAVLGTDGDVVVLRAGSLLAPGERTIKVLQHLLQPLKQGI